MPWNPLTDRPSPPKAARFVARWRIDGLARPRKRALTDPEAADADDPPLRERADQHGWGVGLYEVEGKAGSDGGALAFGETESTSIEALFSLLETVTMRPSPLGP